MIYRAVVVIVIYDKFEKTLRFMCKIVAGYSRLSDAVTEGFCADARFRNQKKLNVTFLLTFKFECNK